MEQYVMIPGTQPIHLWCADNWDFLFMVTLMYMTSMNTTSHMIGSIKACKIKTSLLFYYIQIIAFVDFDTML